MAVIQVENLVKQYQNGVRALNGLSLTVNAGDIFSLLGQNGAGKSTLINILTTYLRPTAGTIQMLDKDIGREASAIRAAIACVAQNISIDAYLSLAENMMFQSRLYKIPHAEAKRRMEHLISCFDLKPYLKYPVASYSGGVKRRLDIALHMMSDPKILFLDEPTVGMDIQSRRAMWSMMENIRADFGTTIFLTTHYMEEADHLSDAVCIMKDGKAVVQDTPAALRKYLRQDMLRITFLDKGSAKHHFSRIAELFAGRKTELRGAYLIIPVFGRQEDLFRAGQFLCSEQIPFDALEVLQPTLEDVFLRLTGDQEGAA
ncbi:ABC transporter ATP-binding protein [Butyricicoccus faecihominis]|uniref:ABC transporter ATP-binding protein n=1 Tax=Butyricicoccus faecihominis TaxID=1712515 RepID=UPI00247AA72A|nr:ABC transporter ATP-binding protein [Butyricicoccus faecihominis]MCQ5130615.1 ABC transporter ATP-binding protein [Butyricicoccus faecihominis]